jgi:3-hydroxybutyryl-CoA dehydrogenase
MSREFQQVGVVGLGTMGAGIAEVLARTGIGVIGVEIDEEAAQRGRAHVENSTARAVSGGKMTAEQQTALLDRIS